MLTNTGYRFHSFTEETDFIHNYYERLVLEEIASTSERVTSGDKEFLADVACVALNRLPPRYIRHDVDMTFFMSPQELQEMSQKVADAVRSAIAYVEGREPLADTANSSPAAPAAEQKTSKSAAGKKTTAKSASKKAKT